MDGPVDCVPRAVGGLRRRRLRRSGWVGRRRDHDDGGRRPGGRDHGVRGRVAHRRVHGDRRCVPGANPDTSSRSTSAPARPSPPRSRRRPGRRVRLGEREQYAEGRRHRRGHGRARVFATNILEIAVPPGNPGGVEGLDDFANPDLLIGLCAEEVPCGQFGREALANAGVTPSIDTNEPDVRSLLTKIEAGELDAGIVYQTDVQSAGDTVEGVEIPSDVNVVATYPIASHCRARRTRPTPSSTSCSSPEGQEILAAYGFLDRDPAGPPRPPIPDRPGRPPLPLDPAGDRRRRLRCLAVARAARADALGRLSTLPRTGRSATPCGCRWSPRSAAPPSRSCSACRWPGCWPGWSSRAGVWCGASCCCRWCSRRSSAAPPCCSPSAGAGSSASGSTSSSASCCRSRPRA